LEKAPWLAPPEKVELCQNKGQAEANCHNFVKVLLLSGKRLFSCGTNAFSPQCSWRKVSADGATGEDLAMTALSIPSTSCDVFASTCFMSGNIIPPKIIDYCKSSLIRINSGVSGLMKQMIALKDKNLESK
jgi:hypothetical protein